MLLEAPLFGGDLDGFLAATAEVRARGFGTLIGHPERCAVLMQDDGAVAAERRAGARLQVNGSSLTGRHGAAARAWGIELLRSGRADVIASDAHRADAPAGALGRARRAGRGRAAARRRRGARERGAARAAARTGSPPARGARAA